MIIVCNNCNKKFEVDSSLIPEIGRKIQCGSCNHTWFYRKEPVTKTKEKKSSIEQSTNEINIFDETTEIKKVNVVSKKKETNRIRFSSLLSYIIVAIISFIGLIVLLDTFKSPLVTVFPNLELLLFSLFETLKDIFLFFKNLIN